MAVVSMTFAGSLVPSEAGEGDWISMGPYGGSFWTFERAPSDASVVYAGSGGTTLLQTFTNQAGDGVFKSVDGGATFTRTGSFATFNAPVRAIAVHPTNKDILYAGTVATASHTSPGIWKSTNGGADWTPFSTDLPGPPIGSGSLAIDPESPDHVYAGTSSGVYKNDNVLDTGNVHKWKEVNAGLPNEEQQSRGVHDILIVPTASTEEPSIFYAAVNTGIFKSSDPEGDGWTLSYDDDGVPFSAVQRHPNDPDVLYAARSFSSVVKSVNGGASWTDLTEYGGPGGIGSQDWTFALAIDPTDAAGDAPPTLFAATDTALWKSTDDGVMWQRLATNGANGLASPSTFLDVDFHPTSVDHVRVATLNGMYATQDGGTAWSDANSVPNVVVRSLLLDPESDSALWAGGSAGGGTWYFDGNLWLPRLRLDATGVRTLIGTVQSMAVDPSTDPPTIYAANVVGVARWDGSSNEWKQHGEGLPPKQCAFCPGLKAHITALAVDPDDPDTMFAGGTFDTGLHRVIDYDGQDNLWEKKSQGLMGPNDNKQINDILVTDEAVYVGSTAFGTIAIPGGVHRSVNNGNSWVLKNQGLPNPAGVNAIIEGQEAPEHEEILYAAAGPAVYKSINAGDTWKATGLSLPNAAILSLATDPSDPARVYAGSTRGRVYRSSDGGKTWQMFETQFASDEPGKFAQVWALAVRDGKIYAGMTGGVFELDTGAAPAPVRKPDGHIKQGNGAFIGNNIYNSNAAKQVKGVKREKGDQATFTMRFQNDGTALDDFKVKGPGASGPFTLVYKYKGDNVTADVKAGTFLLDNVPKNKDQSLTVTIGVKNSAKVGDKLSALVKATSTSPVKNLDALKATVTVKKPS